jgi:hypothetical protein
MSERNPIGMAILQAGMLKSPPQASPYPRTMQRSIARPTVTDHAYKRAKERIGIKGKAVQKRVEDAWHNGLMLHETEGVMHAWLSAKMRLSPHATGIRLLGRHVFMFVDQACITILHARPEV